MPTAQGVVTTRFKEQNSLIGRVGFPTRIIMHPPQRRLPRASRRIEVFIGKPAKLFQRKN